MKMLAVEFSAVPREVALLEQIQDGSVQARSVVASAEERPLAGLRLVETALREAGWDRSDIEAVAVGLGPGSYTGIRAALALAQGWHLARQVLVLGNSSMESIAARAWEVGVRGWVCVVVDAQRGELYVAEYELADAGWRELKPLRLADACGLRQGIDRRKWQWVGPEVTRWFSEGIKLGPSAVHVGRLALRRGPCAPESFEPIYLRPVQFVKTPVPNLKLT
ncbi:MAG: tRNA (adenosine(37)-N6)-threonylcarbamoyltransferase complex dimerization subunit type 1 TsaB [Verrucomicrobiota bacterium]|nr:tRNA (adenosine(37)-N6)-threonylcarbamoyltransferase complex dimerization subunit type 1 TsaB [Limisphaera sp.]MDW8381804.1 tRNA (adenosine(37)-N6)-threonylcarbamoyltransferase complex dimerization subunit type 1 TsaB [Verrucomicrobiota bacterium]